MTDSSSDADLQEPEEHTVARRSLFPRGADGVRVEVNLDAVVANAREVQARIGPSKKIIAVLKGDAYGHGLVYVARALERDATVDALMVTSLQDGLALRGNGIAMPILTVLCQSATAHGSMLDAGLTPVVASKSDLETFARAARARGMRAAVHVELDTGMSRLGVREDAIDSFLHAAARCGEIVVSGLCTHLASADSPSEELAHRQLDVFERVSAAFWSAGHRPTMVHAANTAATFRLPRSHFSHVRTGIGLFGGDGPSGATLRPAIRMTTSIAQLRSIGVGETVSYGGNWAAVRPSRIATLPVGYAHGYPRRLSGRAEVLIRGRRFPVVGSICMEMTMVDVTDLEDPFIDEDVVLLGRDRDDEIRATDLAEAMGGIVEELFCGITKSVSRKYVGTGSLAPRKDSLRDLLTEAAKEGNPS